MANDKPAQCCGGRHLTQQEIAALAQLPQIRERAMAHLLALEGHQQQSVPKALCMTTAMLCGAISVALSALRIYMPLQAIGYASVPAVAFVAVALLVLVTFACTLVAYKHTHVRTKWLTPIGAWAVVAVVLWWL